MRPKLEGPNDDLILDQIVAEELDYYWPVMEPHLAKGIDRVTTSTTIEMVRDNCRTNRWSAWAIYLKKQPIPIFAAACTSLRKTNKGKVVTIELLGGENSDLWIVEALAQFETLARANGAVKIEIEGRRGWERYLTGFKTVRVVLEKVL